MQLTSVQDADGKKTFLYYENPTFSNYITKVVDPFNRTSILQYDSVGYLTNIVDVAGLASSFVYDIGVRRSWITNMTTPYGLTSFRYGGVDAETPFFVDTGNQVNRFVEITLPNGGKQLYLYRHDCNGFLPETYSSVPSTSPLTNTLDNVDQNYRDSFHWNSLQYSGLSSTYLLSGDVSDLSTADYRLGRLRHWLSDTTDNPSYSLSLERAPSPDGTAEGQMTWYDYDGKTNGYNYVGTIGLPSLVALVLPDTTTRFSHYTRGTHSQPTEEISTYTRTDGSVGLRTNVFIFAQNGIDLLRHVGPQGEQVVSNYFNNSYHQPDKSYDALNQETLYTYNTNRQLTSFHGPSGLTTTNIYFANGNATNRLDQTIDLEIGRTNSYTYYHYCPV